MLNLSRVAAIAAACAFRIFGAAVSMALAPLSLLIAFEAVTFVAKLLYNALTTEAFHIENK